MRARSVCSQKGCAELVVSGLCDRHLKERMALDRSLRGSSTKRGYDKRWRRVRDWYLARNPLCEPCFEQDRTAVATEVDHIVPLAQGGERLDEGNLQAICRSCHAKKTARERGEGGV